MNNAVDNDFTGILPSNIGTMTNLQEIDFGKRYYFVQYFAVIRYCIIDNWDVFESHHNSPSSLLL